MSESISKNKTLMRRIYEEMWNAGNPAVAAEIFAQPEGVVRFVSQFLSSFPDLQHTIEEMIEEGDQVAVQFSARGTHQGQWLQFPSTGRSIQYTGVTIARIEANKIVKHYTWWDQMGLVEQLSKA
ncbi:MAG TPA: ester cyclase [Anaerolineales bacterium]|nr:ester cyclase [Anaerolineales bacterium]